MSRLMSCAFLYFNECYVTKVYDIYTLHKEGLPRQKIQRILYFFNLIGTLLIYESLYINDNNPYVVFEM